MRFIAPVLIVLILVLGALIALKMVRNSNNKKEEQRKLSNRATLAESAIRQIENEINTAQSAGMSIELFILDTIINEYEDNLERSNNKEIAR